MKRQIFHQLSPSVSNAIISNESTDVLAPSSVSAISPVMNLIKLPMFSSWHRCHRFQCRLIQPHKHLSTTISHLLLHQTSNSFTHPLVDGILWIYRSFLAALRNCNFLCGFPAIDQHIRIRQHRKHQSGRFYNALSDASHKIIRTCSLYRNFRIIREGSALSILDEDLSNELSLNGVKNSLCVQFYGGLQIAYHQRKLLSKSAELENSTKNT